MTSLHRYVAIISPALSLHPKMKNIYNKNIMFLMFNDRHDDSEILKTIYSDTNNNQDIGSYIMDL